MILYYNHFICYRMANLIIKCLEIASHVIITRVYLLYLIPFIRFTHWFTGIISSLISQVSSDHVRSIYLSFIISIYEAIAAIFFIIRALMPNCQKLTFCGAIFDKVLSGTTKFFVVPGKPTIDWKKNWNYCITLCAYTMLLDKKTAYCYFTTKLYCKLCTLKWHWDSSGFISHTECAATYVSPLYIHRPWPTSTSMRAV